MSHTQAQAHAQAHVFCVCGIETARHAPSSNGSRRSTCAAKTKAGRERDRERAARKRGAASAAARDSSSVRCDAHAARGLDSAGDPQRATRLPS
eukprot:394612-Prymnesium_polylepis.1